MLSVFLPLLLEALSASLMELGVVVESAQVHIMPQSSRVLVDALLQLPVAPVFLLSAHRCMTARSKHMYSNSKAEWCMGKL